MLLLLLLFVLLHRHNGAHSICDVLAAAMRQNPLMHIIGYDVPPCLAFHSRSACCSRRFTVFRHSLLSQIFISFVFNLVCCATDVETSFNQIEFSVVSVIYHCIALLNHFLALPAVFTICYSDNILEADFVISSSATNLTNIIVLLSLACLRSCEAANFPVVSDLSHRNSTL